MRSSSPRAPARAWPARRTDSDKMDADLLGRPLLRWSVEAMAAAESVDRIDRRHAPDRVEALAAAGVAERRDGRRGRRAALRLGPRRRRRERGGRRARPRRGATVGQPALVDAVAGAAAEHGAAVPVVPVVDSLKRVEGDAARRVRRARRPGAHADTAGCPARAAARRLRRRPVAPAFSDEAALLESRGIPVATVPGEPANIKVTDPSDLELVRAPSPPAERASGSASARTATRSARTMACGSAAAACSKARHDCTATPTATSCSTPWRRPSSRRAGWATSAASSRRPIPRRRASPAAELVEERGAPGRRRRAGRSTRAQVSVVGARPRLGGAALGRDARSTIAEAAGRIERARSR